MSSPHSTDDASSGGGRDMAGGTRRTRGTGQSLIGSNNKYGATPGQYTADVDLEGSDMLVEVLAEEFRHKRNLEFADSELTVEELLREADDSDAADGPGKDSPPPPKGPYMQHRKYLTHRGVGDGTVFRREAMAAQARLDRAQESAFQYRLPTAVRAQREALERQRKHGGNLVEEAIVRAMADGQFDGLEGKGKRLPDETNPYIDPGTQAFNRVLQRAGCAPRWVEENRDIRTDLQLARLVLAGRWKTLSTSPGQSEARAHPAWREEVCRFREKVTALNKRVANYNLMAPAAASHIPRIDEGREVLDVEEGRTVYDERALLDLSDGSTWSVRAHATSAPARAALSQPGQLPSMSDIATAPIQADMFSFSWRMVADALSGLGSVFTAHASAEHEQINGRRGRGRGPPSPARGEGQRSSTIRRRIIPPLPQTSSS